MGEMEFTYLEPEKKVGLLVVVTGNGKGKTTTALGIALRASGYDMKVCIIHFMKGDIHSGELEGIKKLSPTVENHLTGKGFCGILGNPYSFEEHRQNAQEGIVLAKEKIFSEDFDVVILDEINNAQSLGLVDIQQITELMDEKPAHLHLVLTGRDAASAVIRKAHTVTEMREIKHAYREGIEPQKGIDY